MDAVEQDTARQHQTGGAGDAVVTTGTTGGGDVSNAVVLLVTSWTGEDATAHFMTPTQADQLAVRLTSMANRVRRAT
jgi:hypothetical protein